MATSTAVQNERYSEIIDRLTDALDAAQNKANGQRWEGMIQIPTATFSELYFAALFARNQLRTERVKDEEAGTPPSKDWRDVPWRSRGFNE